MLDDIAVLTAGRVISEETGFKLENVTTGDLGTAKKIIIDKDNTTIIEGGGKTEDIKGRIGQIKNQIDASTSDMTKRNCRNALLNSPEE